MTRIIPLTHGRFTYVDDEDYEWLNQWSWFADPNGYAVRLGGKSKRVIMHRLILGAETGQMCDHINRVKFDNRRENLRIVDYRQNTWNQNVRRKRHSGLPKGVVRAPTGNYQASIKANGKMHSLGFYKDPQVAGLAFDRAAREVQGEYAVLNYPQITDYADLDNQRIRRGALDDWQVRAMRRAREECGFTYEHLAAQFGVVLETARLICQRRSYKHVDREQTFSLEDK